jgi:hypothetical protein
MSLILRYPVCIGDFRQLTTSSNPECAKAADRSRARYSSLSVAKGCASPRFLHPPSGHPDRTASRSVIRDSSLRVM